MFDSVVYSMTYIPGVSKVMNKIADGAQAAGQKAKDVSGKFTQKSNEQSAKIEEEEFSVHKIDYEKRFSKVQPYGNTANAVTTNSNVQADIPNYKEDTSDSDRDRYVTKDEPSIEEKAQIVMDKILDFFEYIDNKVIYWRTTMIAALVIQFILHFIDEERRFHTLIFTICGLLSAAIYNVSLRRKKDLVYRLRDYAISFGVSIAGRYLGTFLITVVLGIFGITILKG